MTRWLAAGLLLSGCATVPAVPPAPELDVHQHLVSPEFAPIVKFPPRDAAALLRGLDEAGIRKAVALSTGYSFADERKALSDPDARTRAENDWTARQVAVANGRLIGFCSANPLRDAALAELDRCLAQPGMRGIKLHFGNAGVTLRNAAHRVRVRAILALAERRRVAVLVHMRARGGTDYGAPDIPLLLDAVGAAAPNVELVVAHLGVAGPGYGEQGDEVMAAFGAAARRRDPRMRNLYFDVASNVTADTDPAEGARIAQRIREVGPSRILYGSDLAASGGSIRASWDLFRTRVPLTPAELRVIARNRPRFAR